MNYLFLVAKSIVTETVIKYLMDRMSLPEVNLEMRIHVKMTYYKKFSFGLNCVLPKDGFIVMLCMTLCDPMDCNLPGSSVHGISQARILEWAAISFDLPKDAEV